VPCSVLAVASLSSGLPAPVAGICWRTVRHRLAAYSNIRFLDDCQVLGLLSNASKTSVTGVRVRHYNYPQQNPVPQKKRYKLTSGGCQWAEFSSAAVVRGIRLRPTSGDSDQLFFLPVAGIGVRLVSGLSGRL